MKQYNLPHYLFYAFPITLLVICVTPQTTYADLLSPPPLDDKPLITVCDAPSSHLSDHPENIFILDEETCYKSNKDNLIYTIDAQHLEAINWTLNSVDNYFFDGSYTYDKCVEHGIIQADPSMKKQNITYTFAPYIPYMQWDMLGKHTSTCENIYRKKCAPIEDECNQKYPLEQIEQEINNMRALRNNPEYADQFKTLLKKRDVMGKQYDICMEPHHDCMKDFYQFFDKYEQLETMHLKVRAELIKSYRDQGFTKLVNGKLVSADYETVSFVTNGKITNKYPLIDFKSALVYQKAESSGKDRFYDIKTDRPFTGKRLLKQEEEPYKQNRQAPATLLTIQDYQDGYPKKTTTESGWVSASGPACTTYNPRKASLW